MYLTSVLLSCHNIAEILPKLVLNTNQLIIVLSLLNAKQINTTGSIQSKSLQLVKSLNSLKELTMELQQVSCITVILCKIQGF